MIDQPSKESLERALKFQEGCDTVWSSDIDDFFPIFNAEAVALEFDAIAKEYVEVVEGTDYFNAEREVEYRALRQQNAALVSALRQVKFELATLVKGESCDHSTGICWCSTFRALEEADVVLALYAPAEEAQGKPASGTEKK